MTVGYNQNVGIGETSPDEKLHVNGAIKLTGRLQRETTNSGFLCGVDTSANSNPIFCLTDNHAPNDTTPGNL